MFAKKMKFSCIAEFMIYQTDNFKVWKNNLPIIFWEEILMRSFSPTVMIQVNQKFFILFWNIKCQMLLFGLHLRNILMKSKMRNEENENSLFFYLPSITDRKEGINGREIQVLIQLILKFLLLNLFHLKTKNFNGIY